MKLAVIENDSSIPKSRSNELQSVDGLVYSALPDLYVAGMVCHLKRKCIFVASPTRLVPCI